MITSSGVKCDVCGNYILPLDPKERINFFSVEAIPGRELHADNKCTKLMKSLTEEACNFKYLPDGPLRQAFEKANQGSTNDE